MSREISQIGKKIKKLKLRKQKGLLPDRLSSVCEINMFYVYVLQSEKDKKLYTGFTHDFKKRLEKHNQGKVESTKARHLLKLIYYEACLNQQYVTHRESYFNLSPIFWTRRKDRYTVLSEVALRVLREYWKAYQPKDWLFPGSKQNTHLTTRTVEKILEDTSQKAD